jgi:hypothetical protein
MTLFGFQRQDRRRTGGEDWSAFYAREAVLAPLVEQSNGFVRSADMARIEKDLRGVYAAAQRQKVGSLGRMFGNVDGHKRKLVPVQRRLGLLARRAAIGNKHGDTAHTLKFMLRVRGHDVHGGTVVVARLFSRSLFTEANGAFDHISEYSPKHIKSLNRQIYYSLQPTQ